MSYLRSNVELLYKNVAVGTAKASFTTEAQINDTTLIKPQAVIPANYFFPDPGSVGLGIGIKARGVISTTGAPTFTLTVRGGAAGNITTAPILWGMAAAFTAGTGVTNAPWEMEGEFFLTAMSTVGANSTIFGTGRFIGGGATTPVGMNTNASLTAPTLSTFDTSINNFINLNAACGTSSPSNSITVQALELYGLN